MNIFLRAMINKLKNTREPELVCVVPIHYIDAVQPLASAWGYRVTAANPSVLFSNSYSVKLRLIA